MMESIETLLADLQDADFNVRALALAEIVEAGRAVAPALVAALPDADATLKPQLAQALAEIAEPGSADALAGLVDNLDFGTAKALVVEQFERSYLYRLMDSADGNVSLAARLAGKERRALGKLLKKHSIGGHRTSSRRFPL